MKAKQDKVLYHFTSRYHLSTILEDGYLKLTESNLRYDTAMYKPVVWLTDSYKPEGHGLEGSLVDKKEIRITVKVTQNCHYWKTWSRKYRIDKEWAAALEGGYAANSWWISEKPIQLSDILKVENVHTGEVYYNRADSIAC